MNEMGEHDCTIDNYERKHGELDRKYNKYYHTTMMNVNR